MELNELKKRLQQHLGDGLVLIIGSGLSCAEGIPGMGKLGDYLLTHVADNISPDDLKIWNEIHPSIRTEGLEAALLKRAPTASLEAVIVKSTGEYIAAAESIIISEVFKNERTLRLTMLLPHLLKPDKGIPIVTTNYDRLVELACEEAGLGVDTMFNGHFAARLEPLNSHWGFCRGAKLVGKHVRYKFTQKVNVFKPHGSLDWYHRKGNPVRYTGDLPLPRLIITPGLNKFRSGYDSPFDKHREKANDAIDKASRFLIIGYGFNDDHLETHLTPRIRSGVRTVILTRTLSEKAKEIAKLNKNVIAAEFHNSTGTAGVCFIVDGNEIFYPGVDYWDLKGFVEGVLSA
ncbi:SIR2 family protein [Providencia rettgeri]|uniref:SIR2 family protein n=1 Tax=Providencia rettgeri TaxID=587 RepID=UPI002360D1BD|nr:SIR2 family protein [Providencia rettgeri]